MAMNLAKGLFGQSPESREGRHRSPRGSSESRENTIDPDKIVTIRDLRLVMEEYVTPMRTNIDRVESKVNTHIEAAKVDSQAIHSKLGELNARLGDVEKKKPVLTTHTIAKSTTHHSKYDPDTEDIKTKDAQLNIKFGVELPKDLDEVRKACDEAFAQIGTSLAQLKADVVDAWKPKQAEGSTVIIQWGGDLSVGNILEARKQLKYAMSTKDGDTWMENTSYNNKPVRSYWPKYKHHINRDEPLYEAWNLLAMQRGVEKKALELDTKFKRNITDRKTGEVLARQQLGSWRVDYFTNQ